MTTNYINNTVTGVLTHLQHNYSQLMSHELLEQEDTVKKTIYNPHNPIATIFSQVKELLKISDIMGTLYTQLHAVKISHIILHRTDKFGLAICEWNCIPKLQKM